MALCESKRAKSTESPYNNGLKIIGSGNKGLANNSKKRLVFDKSRVNVINDFGTMLQRKAQLQSFCEEILKMAMSS